MEYGTRFVGLLLRFLNFILAPIFWFRGRNSQKITTPPPALMMKSVKELAGELKAGKLTSELLVTTCINRVKEVNSYLNAVVEERYRAATEDAKEADRTIQKSRENGTLDNLFNEKPLVGIPCTIKESLSLAGLSDSVGCVENAGSRATVDGDAVKILKDAGAIPLLVSNTPEMCLGWETTNLLRGSTNNPYSFKRTPGGSSGGEAALLACGASCFGAASDVAGSIRLPAAFTGLCGHKPTPGIISIGGHIPYLTDEKYDKFLAVGPMTRKAEDLSFLLKVMAGDKRDQLKLDEPVDLKKLKVLYMTEAGQSIAVLDVHPAIKQAIRESAKYLEKCGATLSEEKFADFEESVEMSVSVFFSMKDIPNMLLDPVNPKIEKSLFVELVKCMFGGASRSLQALGFALIQKSKLYVPDSKRDFYDQMANKLTEHIKETLSDNGVLLYPTFVDVAHEHYRVFPRASGVLYTMIFNILGLPSTVVPVGWHNGLPIGIQVVAAPYQDRLCLAVAKQLEEGFGGWNPPHEVTH